MKKLIAAILFFTTAVMADEWQKIGAITEIRINSMLGRIEVYGRLDPSCTENHFWWPRSRPESKEWLALAMTAYTAGKFVEGWVGNSCEINNLAMNDGP